MGQPQPAPERICTHVTNAGVEHALSVRAGFLRGVHVQAAQQKPELSLVPHECLLFCLRADCQEERLRNEYFALPPGEQKALARIAWLIVFRQCMADSVLAKTRSRLMANIYLAHFNLELLP